MSTRDAESSFSFYGLVDGNISVGDRETISSASTGVELDTFTNNEISQGLTRPFARISASWTKKDEELLLELFLTRFGNDWTQYQEYFPIRTISSIKSKFHNLVRATHRKYSKIHSETHQHLALMIKRAQGLIKTEVRKPKSLRACSCQKHFTSSTADELFSDALCESSQKHTFIGQPPALQSPANSQLNELALHSPFFSTPSQHASPSLSACGSNFHDYTTRVSFSTQTETPTLEKFVRLTDNLCDPCLYLENGRLFSTPIDYFGSISLPFIFGVLSKPASSVSSSPFLSSKSEETIAHDGSSKIVWLTDGAYLTASCTHCGSVQTLIVRQMDDILVFNMIHYNRAVDPGDTNGTSPTGPYIMCKCPVCNTSIQLTKVDGNYAWNISYSTSFKLSAAGARPHISKASSYAAELPNSTCASPTPDSPTAHYEPNPFAYQAWEVDSPDYFSPAADSSSTYLNSCASGSFESTGQYSKQRPVWSNQTMLSIGASDAPASPCQTIQNEPQTSLCTMFNTISPVMNCRTDHPVLDAVFSSDQQLPLNCSSLTSSCNTNCHTNEFTKDNPPSPQVHLPDISSESGFYVSSYMP